MLDQLEMALVKTLQDTARIAGVLLWGVLKVCGLAGLFGTVVTEALNAVITGPVHDPIRGSLLVSLGLFGLSLLAHGCCIVPWTVIVSEAKQSPSTELRLLQSLRSLAMTTFQQPCLLARFLLTRTPLSL